MIVKIFRKLLTQRFIPLIMMAAENGLLKNQVLCVLGKVSPALQDRLSQRTGETAAVGIGRDN